MKHQPHSIHFHIKILTWSWNMVSTTWLYSHFKAHRMEHAQSSSDFRCPQYTSCKWFWRDTKHPIINRTNFHHLGSLPASRFGIHQCVSHCTYPFIYYLPNMWDSTGSYRLFLSSPWWQQHFMETQWTNGFMTSEGFFLGRYPLRHDRLGHVRSKLPQHSEMVCFWHKIPVIVTTKNTFFE